MYKSVYVQQLINHLAEDGEKAIQIAYGMSTFKNRTFNLHDSYGSAVFYDGALQKNSVRYIGAPQSKTYRELGTWEGRWVTRKDGSKYFIKHDRRYKRKKDENGNYKYKLNFEIFADEEPVYAKGREEVDRFFLDYARTIKGSKGLQLVIVAAMFYASILERGGGQLRRKYKVISGAGSFMRTLKDKYGGELYRLKIWRDFNQPLVGSFKSPKTDAQGYHIDRIDKIPFR